MAENGIKEMIRFVDSKYHELFKLEDGGIIVLPNGSVEKVKRLGSHHFEDEVGNCWHITQFAELMEDNGGEYARPATETEQMLYSKGCRLIMSLDWFEEVYTLFLGTGSYVNNGNLYVAIYDATNGELFDDLTCNIGKLGEWEGYVKQEYLPLVTKYNLGWPTGGTKHGGDYVLCSFNSDLITRTTAEPAMEYKYTK